MYSTYFLKLIFFSNYFLQAAGTNSKDKGTRRHRVEVFEEVTCGVCQQSVPEENWLEHIGKEHNYLSWKDGQDEPWVSIKM